MAGDVLNSSLWSRALARVQATVHEGTFQSYLEPTTLIHIDGNTVVVGVPSPFFRKMIQNHFRAILLEALHAEAGTDTLEIEFRVVASLGEVDDLENPTTETLSEVQPAPDLRSRAVDDSTQSSQSGPYVYTRATANAAGISDAAARSSATRLASFPREKPNLNPRLTFDRYVVGDSNRFAHAACRQVAEPVPTAYNPLVIYGGVGLGKTHLMQAIGHQLLINQPDAHVVNLTSEEFLNSYVDALRHDRMAEFREKHRSADLILLDDIQFIAGKDKVQEEFHHTFNALYDAKKKIVMTSDRSPRDITTLDDRVRNRMHWGLVVDVQPPDLETRMAILMKKAEVFGLTLGHDVAGMIAERVRENVRELEGVLIRLQAYTRLDGSVVTVDAVRETLRHFHMEDLAATVTVDDVLQAVGVYFDLKRSDLIGAGRQRKVAAPRHLAMYIVRKLIGLSYPEIGEEFGGRDHTSGMHGVKKIEASIETDAKLRNLANYLMRQCQGKVVG
jgi:chromosomal replication initiator protein